MRDRSDGRAIRDLKGTEQILIDLKPNRVDSYVYIDQKMDLTNLVKYITKKKKEGIQVSYFHAFVTAIAKTFYNRPKLNRYVANRHVYEHNDVVISFVAKASFTDHSEELMVMLPIDKDDNLESISKKTRDKVEAIRVRRTSKKGANNAVDIVGKLPNIIRVPLVGIVKWCDKVGILPKSLIEDNLYYSSIIVSNLGSIKCGAIHHNNTNFGTCSSLATMGEIKKEKLLEDGKETIKDICNFGINFDERVADGYYFAKSIKLIQYIFDHPELLDEPAAQKIDMGEIR